MPQSTRRPLRGARDRLVDLLGIGETYPLQDLTVEDEGLTVPIGTTAKIPMSPSQTDVRYLLRGPDERPVGPGPGWTGTGGVVVLETPAIEEDITFKVLARKVDTQREAYLHERATVKVGLDRTLVARILAPTLDPGIPTPAPTDPRIVDYGSRVEVEIERSQEGVDYRLLRLDGDGPEIVLSEHEVRGNLGSVVLRTGPVAEDIEIRIRATKTFDPSEGRESQSDLLATVLPLKVRANPAVLPSLDPSPVLELGQDAAVTIEHTQESVSYRLYARRLGDRDFVYGAATGEVIAVDVGGGVETRVLAPAPTADGDVPADYVAVGEARPGNGGELRLPLPAPADDSLLIVAARKTHRTATSIPSVRRLAKAMAVLVRPNPAPELHLVVPVAGGSTRGPVRLSGGQPGVYYHLRRGATGAERGLPAYFHKVDEEQPELNKGIDQLRMSIDFAVAADPDEPRDAAVDPARERPALPTVEMGPLPLDIDLHLRAVKARSRVAMAVAASARVDALPQIQLSQEPIASGTRVRIEVPASVVGERYQPFVHGEAARQARNGNGDTLVFVIELTDEVNEIEVRVTRPGAPGIPVERRVTLTVNVA